MLGIKLVMDRVVGLPADTPTEELATPKALVDMDKPVPAGFALGLMLTVILVVNTWNPTRVGKAASVVEDISLPATL